MIRARLIPRGILGAPALTSASVSEHLPQATVIERVARWATGAGFQVRSQGATSVSIEGDRDTFERVFQVPLVEEPSPRGVTPSVVFRPDGRPRIPAEIREDLETVAFVAPAAVLTR